ERGAELRCDVIQIFVKNQRQWAGPSLKDEDIRLFKAAKKAAGIATVFAHDTYLINLATPERAMWKKSLHAFVDEMERCEALGLGRIRAFHVNDSKKPLGCRVDRHENIGKGTIGLEAFRCLMRDERFRGVPKVIETPKEEGMDPVNLGILREMMS